MMQSAMERKEKSERRRALEAGALKVRCPACGAMPNEICVANELGEPVASMHKVRIRLSTYAPVPS